MRHLREGPMGGRQRMGLSSRGYASGAPPFRRRILGDSADSGELQADVDQLSAPVDSVAIIDRVAQSVRTFGIWIRDWDLWTHTTRLGIAWILACELGIAAWTIFAIFTEGAPSTASW